MLVFLVLHYQCHSHRVGVSSAVLPVSISTLLVLPVLYYQCLFLPVLVFPELYYQWQKDGEFIYTDRKPYIFKSLNGKLYFSYVTNDDEGAYVCIVSVPESRFSFQGGRRSKDIELQVATGCKNYSSCHALALLAILVSNTFVYMYPQVHVL